MTQADDDEWEWPEEPTVGEVLIPEVERSRRKIRRLYGPHGEVLRSFSNKPPTGFHQGERGVPR